MAQARTFKEFLQWISLVRKSDAVFIVIKSCIFVLATALPLSLIENGSIVVYQKPLKNAKDIVLFVIPSIGTALLLTFVCFFRVIYLIWEHCQTSDM